MNYCTLWPEGWWAQCCSRHDDDYLNGVDKLISDENLMYCVFNSSPEILLQYPTLAMIMSAPVGVVMFVGVFLFGRFFYKPK